MREPQPLSGFQRTTIALPWCNFLVENLPPGSPAPLCPMPLGRVPPPQAAPVQEGWVVDGATCLTWGAMRPEPSPRWSLCLWLVSPSSLFVPFFSDLLAFGPEDFLISCWDSIFAKRELAPETQGGRLRAWASQSGCRDHCGAGCAHLAQGKGLGTWSVLCSSHTIRVTPKGRADAENKAFSRARVMRAMKPSLGPHVEAWSRVGSCLGL